MQPITPASIEKAASMLKKVAYKTPLIFSPHFSRRTGLQVYFKTENLQATGSFKVRGAYYKMASLSDAQKEAGVVAASAGNHAQGVALAGGLLNIKAKVYMPRFAPVRKVSIARELGAEVVLTGEDYNTAYEEALRFSQGGAGTLVHAFDDAEIITGQGTVALEFLQDIPSPDAVVVPVGGGGLLAGISIMTRAQSSSTQIYGVQAKGAAAACRSFYGQEEADPIKTVTIADGIAVKRPGRLTLAIMQQRVDDLVCVEDEDIAEAVLLLLDESKLLVEGAGAVGLAALLTDKVQLKEGSTVVVVLSGGNIDVNFLDRIIERGLVKRGRLLKVSLALEDRPGRLKELLEEFAKREANVLQINHDRLKPGLPLGASLVEVILETKDREHGQEILSGLKKEESLKLLKN